MTVGGDAPSVAPSVDRRIVSDAYPRHILQDKFVWGPSRLTDARLRDCVEDTAALQRRLADAGIGYRQVCPFGPLWVRISARSHRKIFLVDDVAYVGGINVSDHNFAWHDAMVRLTDPVLVEGLAASFEGAWRGEREGGRARIGDTRPVTAGTCGVRADDRALASIVAGPFQ